MKPFLRSLVLSLLFLVVTAPAVAQETALGSDTLQSRSVTVYQGNLALVNERHAVGLGQGAATIELTPVPAGLMPETARLSGEGVRVDGLRLETAALSEAALLRASVGRTIGVVRTDPGTGARTVVPAQVLSVRDGVVLRVGDKIESGATGPFQFDTLPPGLRPFPALLANVAVGADGASGVNVQYLTTGLSWRADYTAQLSGNETMVALKGYVTLENTTDVAYPADLVRVVAGDVHRVSAPRPGAVRALAMEVRADEVPVSEAAGAYHLYTLPETMTVPASGTIQRALLELPQLAVRKAYVLEAGVPVRPARGRATASRPPLRVVLRFKNPKAGDGGVPMPGGVVRVFGPAMGGPVFLGEDRMAHTPAGNDVELTIGAAFDVTAERRQTDYLQRGGERVYEVAHEIVLRNARAAATVVEVIEHLPGDWEILEESVRHAKTSASMAAWSVSVPARGETVLTYRALIRQ